MTGAALAAGDRKGSCVNGTKLRHSRIYRIHRIGLLDFPFDTFRPYVGYCDAGMLKR